MPIRCNHHGSCAYVQAASTLRNGKCPGLDGIPPELVKLEGILDIILPILNQALDSGHTPLEWRQAGLLPLFKKGDRNCSTGKRSGTTPSIRYNQNGFCPGRSTVQHVLSFRQILEQCRGRTQTVLLYLWTSVRPSTVSKGVRWS